jgi:hypothetical protein
MNRWPASYKRKRLARCVSQRPSEKGDKCSRHCSDSRRETRRYRLSVPYLPRHTCVQAKQREKENEREERNVGLNFNHPISTPNRLASAAHPPLYIQSRTLTTNSDRLTSLSSSLVHGHPIADSVTARTARTASGWADKPDNIQSSTSRPTRPSPIDNVG